jgi:hypothetical protein
MRVGAETAITIRLIALLSGASISSANILTDIPKSNPLNIDWDPAPAPEDGPPLSRGASRDPSLLPAQIGGIIGAYLFSVCTVGIALILIGRKLRVAIQSSPKVLDIEMVEPRAQITHPFDPTPVSPSKGPRNFSWPSPEKTDRNPYVFPSIVKEISPVDDKNPYVDHRIVQADREMQQRDLEDLYAHVMEQDAAKAAGVSPKEMPPPPQLQTTGLVPMVAPQRQDSQPRRIEKQRPSQITISEEPQSPKPQSRTSSIISSLKSPRKKGLRSLRISSPIPTPVSATFPQSAASDEEPLSPRYHTPPPPPPVPKDQAPFTHTRTPSHGSPVSPERSIAEQTYPYSHSNRSYHRANPSQTSVQSSRGDPSSATSQTPLFSNFHNQSRPDVQTTSPSSRKPQPIITSNSPPPSNNSSVRALPLRQFEPALNSPSFSMMTRRTVLETTQEQGRGPNTGGLNTPWSAGAVPYSPYQPFTPIMPITPRLVTKEERKAKKKAQGRTPAMELIKSDDELWDSGY